MTELMLFSDSPPAWRASVRHHEAISLFINLLGVVMNFIWRIARAPKSHCLHFRFLYLFISPPNPPLFYFNLYITQKHIRTVNTIMFCCCYIYSFVMRAEKSLKFSPVFVIFERQVLVGGLHQIFASRKKNHVIDYQNKISNRCFSVERYYQLMLLKRFI